MPYYLVPVEAADKRSASGIDGGCSGCWRIGLRSPPRVLPIRRELQVKSELQVAPRLAPKW